MQQHFATLPFVIREFGLALPSAAPRDPVDQAERDGGVVLTVVVEDLAVAGAALAAQLGGAGRAVDPADLLEAGLAQRFDLDGGWLLAIEPGDNTAAREFLLTHGEGLYAIAVGRNDAAPAMTVASVVPAARPLRHHQPDRDRRNGSGQLLRWAGVLMQLARVW